MPVIFEFGAGKDLSQNLFLSSSAMKQYLIDLNFMLDLELCEAARLELVNECLLEDKGPIFSIEDLLKYGIDYRAPADASDTPFPMLASICVFRQLRWNTYRKNRFV